MKFAFKDITNSEIYEASRVLFVVGPYNIFNNIAIDEVRERCKPSKQEKLSSSLLSDFDMDSEDSGEIRVSNTVNIETFIKVINISSMSGKWFASVDYTFLSKKQKDWLNTYIKEPSNNGRLVVYCSEWKDYKFLLKHKIILNSPKINIIQLSFPYREVLESVVTSLFEQKGVRIEASAVELFIMRMSNSYDKYNETIDKVITESVPISEGDIAEGWKYTITYSDTLNAMKGIENFILDDFIDKLLNPLNSDKSNGKNKIYKMLSALLEEMGPKQLVTSLRYRVNDYIEFRLAINSGYIPIMVRFSVPEAKERIARAKGIKRESIMDELDAKDKDKNTDTNKDDDADKKKKELVRDITKISDYTFRKMAVIASRTSLKDWVYMKMLLANTKYQYDDTSYEKVLYSLINRSVLNTSRINNDIGIENVLNISIDSLDKTEFSEENLIFNNMEVMI